MSEGAHVSFLVGVVSLTDGGALAFPEAPEATVASSRNESFKSQRSQCSKDLIPFSLLIIFPGCRSQVSHPFSSSLGGN